jgi:hypothetical protein
MSAGERPVDNDQGSTEAPEESVVTVRLTGLEEVVPQYVNLVHANSDRDVFQVIFSTATPPVLLGPEDLRVLQETRTVPGKVVARLIFTPRVFEEMIDVLQTQLRNRQESLEQGDANPTEPANG